MFQGYSPVVQALQGTLFTWGLTALGAATAVFIRGNQRLLLDISLGFAGGVMLAASYWSLLAPALEMAGGLETYGENGEWVFVPVAIGFFLGALFVYGADVMMSSLGISSPVDLINSTPVNLLKKDDDIENISIEEQAQDNHSAAGVRRRIGGRDYCYNEPAVNLLIDRQPAPSIDAVQWRRILLLIVAITVHNIPEGLAVGVGFGAVGKSKSATFESARNLAIGIGIQNFPEGLSVSLPLKAAGFSTARAVWYGQLSGLVEPVAGVLGAALVTFIVPILPYALAFAAGAMVYVVVDDIIPEAHAQGNGKASSWGVVVGFIVMMSLDVALG